MRGELASGQRDPRVPAQRTSPTPSRPRPRSATPSSSRIARKASASSGTPRTRRKIFYILDVLPGGYVFICDVDEWRRIDRLRRLPGLVERRARCAVRSGSGLPRNPGDVIAIDRLNVVHTVIGCVLAEFATVSTDMVDRLHDQNEGRPIPSGSAGMSRRPGSGRSAGRRRRRASPPREPATRGHRWRPGPPAAESSDGSMARGRSPPRSLQATEAGPATSWRTRSGRPASMSLRAGGGCCSARRRSCAASSPPAGLR